MALRLLQTSREAVGRIIMIGELVLLDIVATLTVRETLSSPYHYRDLEVGARTI